MKDFTKGFNITGGALVAILIVLGVVVLICCACLIGPYFLEVLNEIQ